MIDSLIDQSNLLLHIRTVVIDLLLTPAVFTHTHTLSVKVKLI